MNRIYIPRTSQRVTKLQQSPVFKKVVGLQIKLSGWNRIRLQSSQGDFTLVHPTWRTLSASSTPLVYASGAVLGKEMKATLRTGNIFCLFLLSMSSFQSGIN
jgi:hypothetical protein